MKFSLDYVHVQAGEIFARFENDSANEWCEKLKNTLTDEVGEMQKETDKIKEEMSQLKVTLYAKFGNNINLEEDEKES